MCSSASGKAYDRPYHHDDLLIIMKFYPDLPTEGVAAVMAALTDAFCPKPAIPIAFLELVDRARGNDCGYYPYPTLPFSAMDLTTAERVQADCMTDFHSVFEGFPLAERNQHLLNAALRTHFGVKIVFFHDCGCSIVPADVDAFATDWYQEINLHRSTAEAVGTEVVQVEDFNDPEWLGRELDMGPQEMRAYVRMHQALLALPRREYHIAPGQLTNFRKRFAEQSVLT